jgi:Family of unknown function (DUF6069)
MSVTTRSRTDVPMSRATTRILAPGVSAAATAAVATTLIALAATAVGVDFEVPEGGESIPIPAFAVSTFVFSVVGVIGAMAIDRWSRRPVVLFLGIALTMTALSLVPPALGGANAATASTLVLTHVAAAAIVVSVLASQLSNASRSR